MARISISSRLSGAGNLSQSSSVSLCTLSLSLSIIPLTMLNSRMLGVLPRIRWTSDSSGDCAGPGEAVGLYPSVGEPWPHCGQTGSLLGVPHLGHILPHSG